MKPLRAVKPRPSGVEHALTFCQGVQGVDHELDDGATHLRVVQGGRAAAPLQGWPRLWEGTKPLSSSFLVLYIRLGLSRPWGSNSTAAEESVLSVCYGKGQTPLAAAMTAQEEIWP